MFVIPLSPIIVAVLIALLVEVFIAPLFDYSAEKLAALCNRYVLFRRGKGILAVDRSIVVPSAGIFLSRRLLLLSSSLKKAVIFGILIGEISLDTEPEDQVKPVSGIILKRLDTFRDIVTWGGISEEVVRELPYIRQACNKGGTFYETAFVGNETICGENELFSLSFEGPEISDYDTNKPCAIGDLVDERLLCEGNKISFPCSAKSFKGPVTDIGCQVRMFELLNETALRYATADSETVVYSDVVRVNFRSPVTIELLGNITFARSGGLRVPMDLVLLTSSIKEDPLRDYDDPPNRTANVIVGVSFHTRVTKTALICFSIVLTIFLSFLVLISFASVTSRQSRETKSINPVNTVESMMFLAVENRVRRRSRFQVLLTHSENGPHVKLSPLHAAEDAQM